MDINQEIKCIRDLIVLLKGDYTNISTKIEGITDAINKLDTKVQKMETRTLSGEDQRKMIEKLETIIKTLTGDDGK